MVDFSLAAAAAIAAGTLTVSAESYWKYNDTTTIDLDETSLKKTTNGHEILNFVAISARALTTGLVELTEVGVKLLV